MTYATPVTPCVRSNNELLSTIQSHPVTVREKKTSIPNLLLVDLSEWKIRLILFYRRIIILENKRRCIIWVYITLCPLVSGTQVALGIVYR